MSDDRTPDDLDSRIAAAKAAHARPITAAQGAAETRGWAVGIEFVGLVLVSAFIGWAIDRWAGTSPWVMIVMLLIGFIGGVFRAMKTSRQFDASPSNDSKE